MVIRGKVFVYTGLFSIAKDENELAVILGHEIAHAVAHHSAERLSSWWIVLVAGVTALVSLFDDGSITFFMDLLCRLPNSRTMEVCFFVLYQSLWVFFPLLFSDKWIVGG